MPNGIDLILADHRKVDDLFKRFARTEDANLVGQIVDALSAHDDAEHAALYPLAGEVLGDRASSKIDRYARAHSLIKQNIEHLMALEGTPLTAAMKDLRAAVKEHVQDEETDLLPTLARRATVAQLEGLAARIEQVKQRAG